MKISNKLIRSLTPYYDPSRVVKDETEELEPTLWVQKYRGKLPDKDIVWLLCHNEFLSDRRSLKEREKEIVNEEMLKDSQCKTTMPNINANTLNHNKQ